MSQPVMGGREPVWTVLDVLQPSADYLAAAGVENARYDAELLLADVLGLSRLDIYLQYERALSDEERGRFRKLLKERQRRVPLQHLLGNVEFFSLPFEVRPGVFIPRPETEILVERSLEVLNTAWPAGDSSLNGAPLRACELGAGSGVVSVSLAVQREDLNILASDICPEALSLTGANAELNAVGERVSCEECEGLPNSGGGDLHLIVSNPPYIRLDEKDSLQPEVRDHDPHAALFGGEDGLDVYRYLADKAPARLCAGGILAVEIGAEQGEDVTGLFREAGLGDIVVHQDYSRRDRVVIARKP